MNTPRRPVVTLTLSGLAAITCLLSGPPAAQAATACSVTPGTTDYNGDGWDDAVVGDPDATVAGVRQAGAVTVLLGDADGRIGEGGARKVITRASLGDTPKAGDRFGYDVALAVTGHRGRCAALLVGVPGADVGGAVDAGMAYLISDLPDLEGTPDLDAWSLDQDGIDGSSSEAGDQFGHAVAITGMTQRGVHRLVIGAPGENAGTAADAGSVGIFEVTTEIEGLAELRQGRRGPLGAVTVPGTPQSGDRFGAVLASGPLELPGKSTGANLALVVGAPGDTVSGRDGAGSVTVLQEEFEHAVLLSQSTPGVPGSAETADGFGASVALSARTSAAHLATLAVGSPGEDAGSTSGTGSVTLFTNRDEKLVPGRSFSQATAGVPGANEAGDGFGTALTFGHHETTLLVGIPGEDIGRIRNAGAVQPVAFSGAQPLRFPASITENAVGTAGAVGTDNRFGQTLGSLHGTAEDILTISSPYALRGSVYVLSDGARVPARSWVPSAGAQRFGWSVGN